jgi:hypothetical protein
MKEDDTLTYGTMIEKEGKEGTTFHLVLQR